MYGMRIKKPKENVNTTDLEVIIRKAKHYFNNKNN